jgi:hypothetical protein
MKKFLFAVIFLFPTTILADTMCVRDNTLVISLDPSISGTTIYKKDAKWVMEFPYGQIHGEATCLSTTETMGQTNAGKIYGTNEYKNTLISASAGLFGTDKNGNERTVCCCRITHPAISAWVVLYNFGNSASCINNCNCTNTNIRGAMFGSVGL